MSAACRRTCCLQVWVNTGDIVLVGLRDYQDEKADVILKCAEPRAAAERNAAVRRPGADRMAALGGRRGCCHAVHAPSHAQPCARPPCLGTRTAPQSPRRGWPTWRCCAVLFRS